MGGGIHAHPRNGRLNLHLDYEMHPILKDKERRLNIILYLNKEWKDEYEGATELWDKNVQNCIAKSKIKFNSAVIFKTNEISWHGSPEKLKCPQGIFRKSFAYYYISPLIKQKGENEKIGNDGSGYRTKATFVGRPNDENKEKMKKLYEIQPKRRIEQKDMDEIWPDWNAEEY